MFREVRKRWVFRGVWEWWFLWFNGMMGECFVRGEGRLMVLLLWVGN